MERRPLAAVFFCAVENLLTITIDGQPILEIATGGSLPGRLRTALARLDEATADTDLATRRHEAVEALVRAVEAGDREGARLAGLFLSRCLPTLTRVALMRSDEEIQVELVHGPQ